MKWPLQCVLSRLCFCFGVLASFKNSCYSAGISSVARTPFFSTQWRQHRNGSECIQLFSGLAPKHVTVHAVISRADLSQEAQKISMHYGSDLKQVLAQVCCRLANLTSHILSACKLRFECSPIVFERYVCIQVQSGPDADDKLPLEQCTAGCIMNVPADGIVFCILLTVPTTSDKFLWTAGVKTKSLPVCYA